MFQINWKGPLIFGRIDKISGNRKSWMRWYDIYLLFANRKY
jgi:hypothetical protein